MVKNPPAMQETQVRSLGWEDLPEKGMTTHSSMLFIEIKFRRLQCELQKIGIYLKCAQIHGNTSQIIDFILGSVCLSTKHLSSRSFTDSVLYFIFPLLTFLLLAVSPLPNHHQYFFLHKRGIGFQILRGIFVPMVCTAVCSWHIVTFLPREYHGQRSLAGYSPWGCKDRTPLSSFHTYFQLHPTASLLLFIPVAFSCSSQLLSMSLKSIS